VTFADWLKRVWLTPRASDLPPPVSGKSLDMIEASEHLLKEAHYNILHRERVLRALEAKVRLLTGEAEDDARSD
jgi:hypothetical protein